MATRFWGVMLCNKKCPFYSKNTFLMKTLKGLSFHFFPLEKFCKAKRVQVFSKEFSAPSQDYNSQYSGGKRWAIRV